MLTPNEVITIAFKALQFARQQILLGDNWLSENGKQTEYQESHKVMMEYMRESTELLFNQLAPFVPQLSHCILEHYLLLSLSSKFSIGNCQELTHQAFEFVLTHYPSLNAEIFYLKGGDHVFLVLNRKANSNTVNPKKWGNAAIICDPWKNKCYFATEYEQYLQSYLVKNNLRTTEPFDPDRHQILPYEQCNTAFFQAHRKEVLIPQTLRASARIKI